MSPRLDRKSAMLSKAVLWNSAGTRLGSTQVTDEIDYISHGGALFRRGEWSGAELAYLFEQCETPTTFTTDRLDP